MLRFADPDVASETVELVQQWPDCVPGVHRLYFDDGRVVLSLYFMDVAFASKKLALRYDALYLDGFSPAKNDAMWKRSVLTSLSKFAKPEATLATWCVSSHVREDLHNAGFEVQKVQGFGKKSQMTVGIYRPKFSHRRSQEVPYSEKYPDRSLLIIGAGMAGAACACEFARRGWKVTVIDEGRVAASAASAIRYAIAHFQPAGDENLLLDFLELVLTCSKRSAVIFLNISTLMDCRRSPETRRSTKSGRDGFKITSLSSFRIIF